MNKYPAWICSDCGRAYGRMPRDHVATFHEGDACGWCGLDDVPVTQPRDFGNPPFPPTRPYVCGRFLATASNKDRCHICLQLKVAH